MPDDSSFCPNCGAKVSDDPTNDCHPLSANENKNAVSESDEGQGNKTVMFGSPTSIIRGLIAGTVFLVFGIVFSILYSQMDVGLGFIIFPFAGAALCYISVLIKFIKERK